MSLGQWIALVVLAVVIVIGAGVAWFMLPPRALSFAGGRPVQLADYKGPDPTGVPAELRNADLVKRGEYLTKAADCEVCHTTEGGQPYSGGLPFKTPFGTLYSPNITADRQTGIGAWSDAEFIRAVHKGIARDGSRLYPAFPYESYTLLSDDDVRAIRAYLFSLPVAHATAPPNALAFPFNQRWLMGFWSAFYNPDQRFRPHEDRSPEWNRGAYLVEGLAHCGDCHTPRNLGQALDNRQKFGGTVTQGWRAYNITADKASGIGAWTDEDVAAYLASGHAAGRGSAGGPMAEAVDVSLSTLTPADIRAMVAYLRTVPAISTRNLPAPRATAASDQPKLMVAGIDPRGKQVFEGACASCHSWSGVSLLTSYATLTGSRSVNDPSAINVAQIVLSGERRRTAQGEVMMPAFGHAYSDTEIAAVSNYVTARFGTKGSSLTAKDVAKLRQ
ncbi:MAG TPA: cytochrome c [Caulobacteraceae bacterium]|jgi:mono/diheme cytochrome c family protein|nr:cytochrome c [Caulobacteraceae bacterium]